LRSKIDRAETIIVTGANRGIGFGIARGLARRGQRVLLACRDPCLGEAARDAIAADPVVRDSGGSVQSLAALDLGSFDSIRDFASLFGRRDERLDALINNAGVFCPEREETSEGFERCLGVNFLGPFLLTRLLLPRLRVGGRIVNLCSVAGLFGRFDSGDLGLVDDYGPFRAYARSKFAIILATLELAKRFQGRIVANAVHPGVVNTRILTMRRWYDPLTDALFRPFILDIDAGAAPVVELALAPELAGSTGQYYSRRRRTRLGPRFSIEGQGRELWELASRLVGLDPEG
jgi:NAD(P)-dependent dehydrogenase (short-subunit alcohol dehydrogenase family)